MSEPAITITVPQDANGPGLRITSRFGPPVEIGSARTIADKLFSRPQLRTNLEKALAIAGTSLELDFATAERVLGQLRLTGLGLLLNVVGDEDAKVRQIEALFAFALDAVAAAGETPTVRIEAHPQDIDATSFPFEILPFRRVQPQAIHDKTSLDAALTAFPAFSAVFDRARFASVPDLRMVRSPDGSRHHLPIKLFIHAGLRAVADEKAYLDRRLDVFVDGPWPVEDMADAPKFIASRIGDPALGFKDNKRALVDQIHHFSCHCDTKVANNSHFFSLQREGGSPIDVELSDLPPHTFDARQNSVRSCDMPLIIFNNCGGAAVDAKQVGSFVEFFAINNRNRGFIGTQARIPDPLAAAFSKYFYALLLRRRQPIGQVVAETRRTIALVHNNPLSLLYSHFGSPWLRVRDAEPDLHLPANARSPVAVEAACD